MVLDNKGEVIIIIDSVKVKQEIVGLVVEICDLVGVGGYFESNFDQLILCVCDYFIVIVVIYDICKSVVEIQDFNLCK